MPRVAGRYVGRDGILGIDLFRPFVLVGVELPGQSLFHIDALIDSGADRTTIPHSILRQFGIAFGALQPHVAAETAGGLVDQRLCPGVLTWRGHAFGTHFAPLRELKTAVIGREDFVRAFSVNFDGWNRDPPSLAIEPHDP